MTPADYTAIVVVPTVREFLLARVNARLAYLSCVASYHVIDYLAVAEGRTGQNKTSSIIDKVISYCDPALRLVQGLCNGTKHAEAGKGPQPGKEQLVGPFAFGQGGFGVGRFSGPPGLVIPHNGTALYIDEAVQSLLLALASLYPIHLAAGAFAFFDEHMRNGHQAAWAGFNAGP
ncbi:hypothetical protein [Labrys monachus]|uniref:Uncharacterized protein n=1 Tax=Labrys monachus TaxID=217067 RepID=A0ABU0FDF3_9HYPH|nr:hypothetical protein [Labrys monachus]MDQ0392634.1 hypothetical protein [Labrys monachus]